MFVKQDLAIVNGNLLTAPSYFPVIRAFGNRLHEEPEVSQLVYNFSRHSCKLKESHVYCFFFTTSILAVSVLLLLMSLTNFISQIHH